MKVLIACEESQTVCIEFRKRGHDAFSCDIQDQSGGHPEWHIKGDALEIAYNQKWDIMIGHPPCTYLTLAANKYYSIDKYGQKAIERAKNREEAIQFFLSLWNAPIPKICLENPVGIMCNYIDKKNYQIVQPYHFGDPERKTTQLWIKNLPPLQYGQNLFYQSDIVKPDIIQLENGTMSRYHYESFKLKPEERRKVRSKTFQGIARAMAEQWG